MKKISIIGANSFIAQNLIEYLGKFQEDYDLFLYDRPQENDSHNYEQINFSNIDEVRKIKFDVDCVMIFLGRTGGVQGFDEYDSFINVNEIYFLNILKCYCEQEYRPRIIYPGTRLIYKESEELINEESELKPKSIYAVTKLVCENYFRIYKDIYGLDYVVLRICTPYGTLIDNKGNYGTFEIFWKQAVSNKKITVFGDGKQKKTYTQMSDICEAFKVLINAEKLKYEIYNLGGQPLSMNDVADVIAQEANVEIEHIPWPDIYRATDGGSVVFDSKRFDSEFGMKYHSII